MVDSFDFGAFNMKGSDVQNADYFWDKNSDGNDNNSFFSEDEPQADKKEFKTIQKKISLVSGDKEISIGQFADPESSSQMKSSGVSKMFNVEKESEEGKEAARQMSRSISDISVEEFEKRGDAYFFQKEIPAVIETKSDNFQILKKYISQPKKMDFDNFFADLEMNQEVVNQSFLNRQQYSNAKQFEDYKLRLKEEKRKAQMGRQQDTQKEPRILPTTINRGVAIAQVIQVNNFKKKPYSNTILEDGMVEFNFYNGQLDKPSASVPVSNKKIPNASEYFGPLKIQDSGAFFQQESVKHSKNSSESKKSKESAPKVSLPVIGDQDENIFQTTQEELKLNNLFQNFNKLLENYNLLRGELKSNNEGHQKLMKQLTTIKGGYDRTQQQRSQETLSDRMRQQDLKTRRENDQRREREENKEKITKIEMEIYKKIDNLETVMKETFENVSQEKNNLVWVNPDFQQESHKENIKSVSQHSKYQGAKPEQDFALSTPRESHRTPYESPIQQIMSPLDLRLLTSHQSPGIFSGRNNGVSPSRTMAFQEVSKRVYTGQLYQPQHIALDPLLKLACVVDNAVVYQSFEFIVTAKYSMVRSNRKYLKITITIKNKTILSLQDFMVILYGSAGQSLQISPSKMFLEKLSPDQSRALEVSIDSIKPGGQPLRMQVSYRTDRDRKSKVSIKIPRPITKFMDIKFTHESQFSQIWTSGKNQLYVPLRTLNFESIKSTDDIKQILPFIDIHQADQREFSYGLIFSILNVEGVLLLKLACTIDGRASIHIKYDPQTLQEYAKAVLSTIQYMMFS